jgi:hypothetical protein
MAEFERNGLGSEEKIAVRLGLSMRPVASFPT